LFHTLVKPKAATFLKPLLQSFLPSERQPFVAGFVKSSCDLDWRRSLARIGLISGCSGDNLCNGLAQYRLFPRLYLHKIA
jgi:hypothetical protein